MKKAMGDRESRLSQWRERILEREQSGISVCAWCANHGFTEQQYYYWCRAVRQEMKSQQCLPCKIMKVELRECLNNSRQTKAIEVSLNQEF